RDVEINPVVGAQPGGTPVDLHDLGETVLDMEPVADLVRFADLEGDARDDAAEQILRREAEDDRSDAGSSENASQLSFGVIANAQDEEKRDQVNEEGDDLAKKVRNGRAPFFFPIQFPEVAIEKGDDERR